MNICISRYKRTLKKKLRCFGTTKQSLLAQFDAALADYLEDHPTPTVTELHAAFGPPEEMALVLMEGVSEAKVSKYKTCVICTRIIAGILAAVFLAFTAYIYMFKEIGLTVIEEVEEIYCTEITEEALP